MQQRTPETRLLQLLAARSSEKSFDRLQQVQNKLVRVVHNDGTHQHHSIGLLRELHWLPSRSRATFEIDTLCHNALRNRQSTAMTCCTMCQPAPYDHLNKDSLKFHGPRPRLVIGDSQSRPVPPIIWNTLLSLIRDSIGTSMFKSNLKSYDFRRYVWCRLIFGLVTRASDSILVIFFRIIAIM